MTCWVRRNVLLLVALVSLLRPAVSFAAEWPELDGKIRNSIEALKRLKHLDVDSNAAIKNALTKTLEKVKGRPEFVELVLAFRLTSEDDALLQYAREQGDTSTGLQALEFLVKSRDADFLENALMKEGNSKIITSLGSLTHPTASQLLIIQVSNPDHPLTVRKWAVQALCRSRAGVTALLELDDAGRLPNDLKLTSAYALNQIPWPSLKKKALEQLPLPMIQSESGLPTLARMMEMEGDISNGHDVFLKPESGCSLCHRIENEGVDFGPGLSEIGTKLGKDALFQSILDPNGGISFGFEGWEVVLNSGDEWIGVLIGETETAITLKNASGLLMTLEKSEIESRSPMKSSLMPSGLQQTMTLQELVDLVTYLSSLQ